MSEPATSRLTFPQVLLGVFIVGQQLFLLLGNGLPFLLACLPPPAAQSALTAPLRAVRMLTDDWERLRR